MSQTATIYKGESSTGFKVILTDEEKVEYEGRDPGGLKEWFEWAEESLDDSVTYDGGSGMQLLPVRKLSFWYWVWQALNEANVANGTEWTAEFEGVPAPPSSMDGWDVETSF